MPDTSTSGDAPVPDPVGSPSVSVETLINSPFKEVPIEIVVSVGHARPLVRDLVNLQKGTVLSIDRSIEDPVELYVGDQLIARGSLEELGDAGAGQLAVKITEVSDLGSTR